MVDGLAVDGTGAAVEFAAEGGEGDDGLVVVFGDEDFLGATYGDVVGEVGDY